jgi:hypothetical protein
MYLLTCITGSGLGQRGQSQDQQLDMLIFFAGAFGYVAAGFCGNSRKFESINIYAACIVKTLIGRVL